MKATILLQQSTMSYRTSVVTSRRSQEQNSGDTMRFLLSEQNQSTSRKSSINHSAINKQVIQQLSEQNKIKQQQREMLQSQPKFKMSRFANVGSKISQQLNKNSNSNDITHQQQSQPVEVENFYFDNYNNNNNDNELYTDNTIYDEKEPVYQDTNVQQQSIYQQQHNDNNDNNDESIYTAFNNISINQPIHVVHHVDNNNNSTTNLHAQLHSAPTSNGINRATTNNNKTNKQQQQQNTDTVINKRQSLKAPLDTHNIQYTTTKQQTNNNSASRNYERENAKAVINAKPARPLSTDNKQQFKHQNQGQVPAYIQQRKAELDEIKQKQLAEKNKEKCPPGTVRMSEEQRLSTLQQLNETLTKLNDELLRFPLRITTEARRVARLEQEQKIKEVEDAIQLFSKKVVYIAQ